MSETKFTPGPWLFYRHGDQIDVFPIRGGEGIALVYGRNAPNAHLIAAAPELYAALAEVAAWIGGMCASRADDDVHNRMLAALAKARGETP